MSNSPAGNPAFEAGVLHAFVTNPRLLRSFRRILKDYHFVSIPLQHLARIILETAEITGEAPTWGELEHLIGQELKNSPVDMRDAVQAAAVMVQNATPTVVTKEYVNNFVTAAEMRALGKEMVSDPDSANLKDRIRRLQALVADNMNEALGLGRNFFGEGPDGLVRTVEDAGKLYDSSYVLQTGWRLFDAIMFGFRPKEGNVILGPTNAGKSEFLIALARVFNAQGKRVVMYGIDSTLEEMSERVVVSQSGVPIDFTRSVEERKKEMLERAPRHNNFIYREWSPNRHRVSDIRLHLQEVADILGPIDEAAGLSEPGKVHAILVDSPYLMLAEYHNKEAHRFNLTSIFYDWIALLKDLDMVGIATHQATREAMEKMSLSLAHVAEALAVVQPVANVFALPSRTMAERMQRTRRLQFLKLRKPEGVGREDRFRVDERRQLLYEDPDQRELGYMFRRGEDQQQQTRTAETPATNKAEETTAQVVDLSDLAASAAQGAAVAPLRRQPPPRRGVGPSSG